MAFLYLILPPPPFPPPSPSFLHPTNFSTYFSRLLRLSQFPSFLSFPFSYIHPTLLVLSNSLSLPTTLLSSFLLPLPISTSRDDISRVREDASLNSLLHVVSLHDRLRLGPCAIGKTLPPSFAIQY